MQTRKNWIQIAALALVAAGLTLAARAAENPTGTWKWSFTPPGGQATETTLKLKVDGGKLSGTVARAGGNETAIEDAKLAGDEISFSVSRERNGQKTTTKYSGKISGDSIKGKSESPRGARDWEAKRSTEK